MCTLIALLGTVPGYPLVVAMNRDEFYDRPSVPPTLRDGPLKIVCPRDERAEGTWIGVNAEGLLAAVSNRFAGPPDPRARSRGLLCLDSLAKHDAAEAAMFASEAADATVYNPFNLLHADAQRVACTGHEDGTWTVHGMRGLNVLTNAGLNVGDPRAQRVLKLLEHASFDSLDASAEAMRGALADHAEAGGRAICHHGERTGTRSQTIVALSERGWQHNRLLYAEGQPCTAKVADLSDRYR